MINERITRHCHYMDNYYSYTLLLLGHQDTCTSAYGILSLFHCHPYRPTGTLSTVVHLDIGYTGYRYCMQLSCSSWTRLTITYDRRVHEYSEYHHDRLISSLHGCTDHCYYMHYHRDITRIIATHRCSTGTRRDQCTDYRISYYCYHYVMFTYHCYTCMSCFHIPVTHAYMVSLFLSYGSLFLLHVLLFHVIPVFMFYD